MGLSLSSYVLWIISTALEVLLCLLIFWRRVQKQLPFFAAYILLQFLTGLAAWVVAREFGFWSFTLFYVAWTITGTLLVAGWLVTAELCYRSLRGYRGIWALAWRLLGSLFVILLLHAAYGGVRQPNHRIGSLILALHRDLALASAAILIAMLVVARHYELEISPLERWIAVGLSAYFIAVLLSDSLLMQWYMAHRPVVSGHPSSVEHLEAWWNGAQLVVFDAALVVWCFALRKALPAPKAAPDMLPAEIYGEVSPAIQYRLRALNARLTHLLKA